MKLFTSLLAAAIIGIAPVSAKVNYSVQLTPQGTIVYVGNTCARPTPPPPPPPPCCKHHKPKPPKKHKKHHHKHHHDPKPFHNKKHYR